MSAISAYVRKAAVWAKRIGTSADLLLIPTPADEEEEVSRPDQVLPPINNARRARIVEILLQRYQKTTACNLDTDAKAELLAELMADIMHYCDTHGLSLHEVADAARAHYLNEIGAG